MILTPPSRAYVAVCQWRWHFPGTVVLSFLTNQPVGSTLRREGDQLNRILTLCFPAKGTSGTWCSSTSRTGQSWCQRTTWTRPRSCATRLPSCTGGQRQRQEHKKQSTSHRGSLRKEGTCLSLQLEYGNQLQLHVYTGIDPRTEVLVLFP